MGQVSASHELLPQAGDDPDRPRPAGPRPWLAAWVIGVAAAFAAYLRLAGTWPVNSDGAGNALQAWAMLHGNVALAGWSLSDVSFYTTELPQYIRVGLIAGLHPDVVPIAAAVTYTLAGLVAAR